jgi:RES domain-containing protein
MLYRALNPVYAREPLSGEGARRFGGRFNPRGVPALYCSLGILTAVRESNQVGTLQPTTLVSYEANIAGIFDCTDPTAVGAEGMHPADLSASTWRDEMTSAGEARTQAFARRLMAKGINGLLVQSFAAGATPGDLNLVLWRWGPAPPAQLLLIDDEGRLTR